MGSVFDAVALFSVLLSAQLRIDDVAEITARGFRGSGVTKCCGVWGCRQAKAWEQAYAWQDICCSHSYRCGCSCNVESGFTDRVCFDKVQVVRMVALYNSPKPVDGLL